MPLDEIGHMSVAVTGCLIGGNGQMTNGGCCPLGHIANCRAGTELVFDGEEPGCFRCRKTDLFLIPSGECGGSERRSMHRDAELFGKLGSAAGMVGMVVGQKDASDAGETEPSGFDVAEEPVGISHHTADSAIDQGQLVPAVEQVDVAVKGRGEIEPEHPAADYRYL